ncbi:MAG: hypothetical protein ABI840_03855 [bacterium]
MKTLIKISFFLFLFTSLEANAQTFNLIEVYTDANCNNVSSVFKIPKGNIAYKFDLKIVPEWSQCSDNERTDFNLAGIRLKGTRIFTYQCYFYRSGDLKESSDLSDFILGPGEYELVLSSNRGNSARLTYYTGTDIPLTAVLK